MSILEAPFEGAMKALYQQCPSRLMAEVEGREVGGIHFSLAGPRGVSTLVIYRPMGGECAHLFTGATGAVQLVEDDHSTGGPAVVQKSAIGRRFKPESVSQDENLWRNWFETTKELLHQSQIPSEPTSSLVGKLRVDRLSAIQAVLGLPTQTMAEVLRVSRPGLYKWLDASQDIAMRLDNHRRLETVDNLAKKWRKLSNAPLSSVAHEPLAAGCTVLELLTIDTINVDAVISAFDELVDKLHRKPKTLSQKMAETGFKRRPSLSSLPTDE